MSEANSRERFEWRIADQCAFQDAYKLILFDRETKTVLSAIELTMRPMKELEPLENVGIPLRGREGREILRALSTALHEAGFSSCKQEGAAAHEATKYHLEDMRTLLKLKK